MRFLVIYKGNEYNEAGVPPSKDLIAESGKLAEETPKTGVLLAVERLDPSSKGARITFSGGHSVTDGPFVKTKELIAGFAIIQVHSKEAAIERAKL